MAQVSEKTTFGLVPYQQFSQLKTEKPAVMRLWYECWECDPYGSRWMQMTTHLTGKTLKEAKARIRALGLFEFKSEVTLNQNGSRYWQMYVLNLQGSKSTGVDKTPNSNRSGVKNYPNTGDEIPHMGQNSTPHGVKDAPSNTSETHVAQDSQQLSLSFKDKKESTTISQDEEVAVFSSSVLSAQQPPDPLQEGMPPKFLDLNDTAIVQDPLCDSNLTSQTRVLSVSQSSVGKIPPAAHVKLNHNTSCSHQDAPQAPLDSQTSNPTPKSFNPPLSPFSLEVEEVLSRLKNSLESKGRMKEIEWEKTLKSLKSYPEQTVLDAVSHCLERLDNIKNLGGYFRKALEGSYKPSQAKEAPKTTKVSQEEDEWYTGSIGDFLSSECIEMYNDVEFVDPYLTKCCRNLRKEWKKGEAKHKEVIGYWRRMQKDKVPLG